MLWRGGGKEWKTRLRQLHSTFKVQAFSRRWITDKDWTFLHYLVALMPVGGALLGVIGCQRIKFIAEELRVDVQSLNADSATALDIAMARGNTDLVRYLLEERCDPPFLPGTCPLQNVACLPEEVIPEIVERRRQL